ncbi:helix-turn-helix domain-containing protein [Paenibacillus lycopersici]|uniref:Helix-turn-helix domain-containing protein n=1 Tax=Paenibacillus lycopersici TaxID=2704462 RepID=A0A6C0FTW5_9BACL|nr:helix-turn-helix domain-containing protein [Paenibacillus lycopersici]QHT58764.1 helix-turn-helix domain-containing protein [Paenibacillus lycopersici]
MALHDMKAIGAKGADEASPGNAWFLLQEGIREQERKASRIIYPNAPSYMLFVAGESRGQIVIDGVLYPLQPGAAFIAVPGQRVETHYEIDGALQYRFLFDVVGSDEDVRAAGAWLAERRKCGVPGDARVPALCEQTAEGWRAADPVDKLAGQAGFLELLHVLLKKQGDQGEALERAHGYLRRHYREAMTVDDLAGAAGMSRYHFMRSFKERFGQSVMEFLAELRTNEAKQLLETGMPLRRVAEAVGYKDPLYFSSQFKKQVGLSPRRYLASRECRVAAYSWPNIGQLLTLGIIPHAAPIDQNWSDDYRRKYRFDVKVPLSHDYEFNWKALLRVRPDRIVALDEMIVPEEKAKLTAIAPTLFLRWHGDSWKAHLTQVARFMERETEGAHWLARYEEQAAEARELVPLSLRRGPLLILNVCARGMQVWGKRAGTVLYDDLGIPHAPGVERIESTEFVTAAQLQAFDADALLVTVMKDRQSQAEWNRLQRTQEWEALKAVRERNVCLGPDWNWLQEPILEYTANRQGQLLQELVMSFRAL